MVKCSMIVNFIHFGPSLQHIVHVHTQVHSTQVLTLTANMLVVYFAVLIYIHIAKMTSHECDIKIHITSLHLIYQMLFSILLPVRHSYVNGSSSCFVHLPFQRLYTPKAINTMLMAFGCVLSTMTIARHVSSGY